MPPSTTVTKLPSRAASRSSTKSTAPTSSSATPRTSRPPSQSTKTRPTSSTNTNKSKHTIAVTPTVKPAWPTPRHADTAISQEYLNESELDQLARVLALDATEARELVRQLSRDSRADTATDKEANDTETDTDAPSATVLTLDTIERRCSGVPLPEVRQLFIDSLSLINIDALAFLASSLTHLYAQRNKITDISSIIALRQLRFLTVSHNAIVELPDLNELELLQFVDLGHNQIEDFDPECLPVNLLHVKMTSNPCCQHPMYSIQLIDSLPELLTLDGETIDEEQRRAVEAMREQDDADDADGSNEVQYDDDAEESKEQIIDKHKN